MTFRTIISCVGMVGIGCATTRGSISGQAPSMTTITVETATVFVHECVQAWSQKDEAVWDKIIDGALLPTGTLPIMLSEERGPSFDMWMHSIPSLTEWVSTHSVAEVGVGLRLVEDLKSSEMRDLRHLSLEQLRGGSGRDLVIPTVQVQGLTLGLDMNKDGEISSEEKTRVHLYNGALYWEPFGW